MPITCLPVPNGAVDLASQLTPSYGMQQPGPCPCTPTPTPSWFLSMGGGSQGLARGDDTIAILAFGKLLQLFGLLFPNLKKKRRKTNDAHTVVRNTFAHTRALIIPAPGTGKVH